MPGQFGIGLGGIQPERGAWNGWGTVAGIAAAREGLASIRLTWALGGKDWPAGCGSVRVGQKKMRNEEKPNKKEQHRGSHPGVWLFTEGKDQLNANFFLGGKCIL